MVKPAVVLGPSRRAEIEIGSTQKLIFDLTGTLTSSGTVGHKFLVGVKMNIDVESNLAVWNPNPGGREGPVIRACGFRDKTQVLKVVDSWSINQLNRFEVINRSSPVVV